MNGSGEFLEKTERKSRSHIGVSLAFGEWEVVFGYALFELLAQADDIHELFRSFSRKEAGRLGHRTSARPFW